jgi:hypothetical protein
VGSMIAEPVRVPTNSGHSPGFLVYANEELLCVVVRIDEQGHAARGRWKISLGLGPCNGETPQPLEYLDEAIRWMVGRYGGCTIREDKIQAIASQMENATIALMACSTP